MMAGPNCFLSPNAGDYSLKKCLHLLCREAIVYVIEFARMDLIMHFGALEFLKNVIIFSVELEKFMRMMQGKKI